MFHEIQNNKRNCEPALAGWGSKSGGFAQLVRFLLRRNDKVLLSSHYYNFTTIFSFRQLVRLFGEGSVSLYSDTSTTRRICAGAAQSQETLRNWYILHRKVITSPPTS